MGNRVIDSALVDSSAEEQAAFNALELERIRLESAELAHEIDLDYQELNWRSLELEELNSAAELLSEMREGSFESNQVAWLGGVIIGNNELSQEGIGEAIKKILEAIWNAIKTAIKKVGDLIRKIGELFGLVSKKNDQSQRKMDKAQDKMDKAPKSSEVIKELVEKEKEVNKKVNQAKKDVKVNDKLLQDIEKVWDDFKRRQFLVTVPPHLHYEGSLSQPDIEKGISHLDGQNSKLKDLYDQYRKAISEAIQIDYQELMEQGSSDDLKKVVGEIEKITQKTIQEFDGDVYPMGIRIKVKTRDPVKGERALGFDGPILTGLDVEDTGKQPEEGSELDGPTFGINAVGLSKKIEKVSLQDSAYEFLKGIEKNGERIKRDLEVAAKKAENVSRDEVEPLIRAFMNTFVSPTVGLNKFVFEFQNKVSAPINREHSKFFRDIADAAYRFAEAAHDTGKMSINSDGTPDLDKVIEALNHLKTPTHARHSED